jgi:predicted MFS family arabinose efflux permease
MMRPSEMFPLARRARPTMLRGIKEGLSYAKHSRTVLVILGMMVVFASLCFNFSILLPVLAKQTLDAGPRTFGVLSTAFGVGALVGALAAATISRASWKTMFIGSVGFATCELLIAPMSSVPVDVVLLFVCGIFFTSYTANSNARIQLETPDHLRGRVLSLYYYAWNGIAPLGALIIGWLSARGGTQLAFAVAGAAGLAMAGVGAVALKRHPRTLPPAEELPEPGEALAA